MTGITHYPATEGSKTGKSDFKLTDLAITSGNNFRLITYCFESLPNCSIQEVHIQERFPGYGYAVNNDCNLAVRVMKGINVTLFIHNEEKTLIFSKGEGFEISKGTPFYIVVEPSAIFLVVSDPPFNKEQAKIVTFDGN